MVVYVGSTCEKKEEGLIHARIREYCNTGSHKADLINKALDKGYEIWFHVKKCKSRQHAETEEDRLLALYDYAWNTRKNNVIRNIID